MRGAAGMVALAFLTLTFPERPPAAGGDRRVSLKRVLSLPVIFWLCIVGTLHRGTICYYDAFYTLHVTRGLDLPAAIGGISVALGVGIEVGVLLLGHRLLERFGATTLVLISVASGLPRWLLTSSLTDPTLLVATQALHGVGFGCWWVGGLALIDRHAPGELRNTAQGLFMAAGHGLGALLAMGLAAVLLDRTDSGTIFLWVAALSGLALVFAVFALRPAVARSAGRARTA